MSDDDLVAFLDQINDSLSGDLNSFHLLRQIVAQCVAAQSDNDTLAHNL